MIKKAIYDKMPSFLKDVAASINGYSLLKQRYKGNYENYLKRVKNREGFSKIEWTLFQENAYKILIKKAYSNNPFYKKKWNNLGLSIDRISQLKNISTLPFLTKEEVKNNVDALLNKNISKTKLIFDQTSGTTGTPLKVFMNEDISQNWSALIEARVRNWANIQWGDRWAMIGGQLVTEINRKKPPFWVWNKAFNQLYMSSYHMKESNLIHYLDEIKKRKIVYIYGYATSIYLLAKASIKFKYQLNLKAVFSNAEPLYDSYRSCIEEAFKCDVRNTYSGSEIVCLASECYKGELHISPDSGYVEIIDDNQRPCKPGEVGEIVATGFTNDLFPMIRYRTGDFGAIVEKECECGMNMNVLTKLVGRQDDIIYSKNGTPVSRMDPVFKNHFPIKLAQIEQINLDKIICRIVPEINFSDKTDEKIKVEIRKRLGDIEVEIIIKDKIELSKNGKFRAVINRMNV